jgi:hypothetical protein
VAAPTSRIVRRRHRGALVASAAPAPLVAASTPLTNTEQLFKAGIAGGGRRNNWQQECWQMYRRIGELRYYVGWRSNSCSRVALVASEIDPQTGRPTGSIGEDNAEGQRVAELVRQIAGGPLGQAALVKRIAENLTVPGEIWVMLLIRPEGLKWFAVTTREIEQGTRRNTAIIKLPDGSKHTFDPAAGDGAFRIWNPDAEDASQPDSPVRANLDSLREIDRTTRKIRNIDNSRLANNGILAVPAEASLPDPQAPVSADKPGDDSPAADGRRVAPKLQQMIIDVAKAAHDDPDSAAALVPIIISVPAEHVDKIRHTTFGKDMAEVEIKKRNDAIARLAMGLDMSVERLLGMGASTNHWSSHMIADEDVQLHIAPVMEMICPAIYDNVLRNVLISEGIDPDKYMLWYDTGALTVDPDKTDEARDAFDRGAITAETLVRVFGLPEDSMYDLESLEGCKEFARDKVAQNPELLPMFAPLLDAVAGIEFPNQQALPPADGPVDDGDEPVDGSEPDTEDAADSGDGKQAAAVSGVELAVVDLLVGRVLELAGSRRRTRSNMERLRDVPSHRIHRYMQPVADDEVSRLISGWDKALDESALKAMGLRPELVRAAVRQKARQQLTAPLVDGQVL